MSQAVISDQPRVKLYWLEQSRSQRILWLLEELSVPYELEIFHRKPDKMAPPELKAIHGLGKSPVISVTAASSTEPVIVAESAFIIEYLLDHFANGSSLLPKRYREGQEGKFGGETAEWLRFRYFLHYSEGSFMPFMIVGLIVMSIEKAPVPFFIRPVTNGIASKIRSSFLDPNLKTHFEFLEAQIASSPEQGKYICGPRLTGADIMISFPLIAAKGRAGLTPEKYPLLHAYVGRLEQEPGYLKSIKKIEEIDGKFEPMIKT
ncbi:glutathione S-transferas-like protein [Calycina marina]|uniref:Glutathione S-transferas-like protein n=1 Tax=Calycina marina TaxID=1763456 RepID=A0A9P7Z9J7_9HELO|nr:glutathione S-transferas-like protein [Calycina marina]